MCVCVWIVCFCVFVDFILINGRGCMREEIVGCFKATERRQSDKATERASP